MQVKLETKVLAERLKQLLAIVDAKAAISAYQHILLTVKGGVATFCANSGAVGFLETTAKVEGDDGTLLLPAKRLADMAGNFQADHVSFQSDGSADDAGNANVTVRCGKFKGVLRSRPASEFALNFDRPESSIVTLPRPGLLDLIERVIFAVPQNSGKYTVPVAKLDFKDDLAQLVATDGWRLVIARMRGEYRTPEGFLPDGMCLPKTALDQIHLLTGGTVKISETENAFFFETEAETFGALKVTGEFPPYEKIIPTTEPAGTFEVAKDDFTFAIGRARPMADDEEPVISFSVFTETNVLAVRSTSKAYGMADDTIEVKASKANQEFILNAEHLLPFVEKCGPQITNEFRSPVSAVIFHSGPDYTIQIAPAATPKAA